MRASNLAIQASALSAGRRARCASHSWLPVRGRPLLPVVAPFLIAPLPVHPLPPTHTLPLPPCLLSLGSSPYGQSIDMGDMASRLMSDGGHHLDAFSDMGSLRAPLEIPPQYVHDEGKTAAAGEGRAAGELGG